MAGQELDFSILSNHLWESANILRGPVDAADFKTYIFPLLFFKRISDVYDEEQSEALEESDGDQQFAHFPENHRFQIPDGCPWTTSARRPPTSGRPCSGPCGRSRPPTRVRSIRSSATLSGRTRIACPTACCVIWSSTSRSSPWATRPLRPTSSAGRTNT